MKQIGRLSGIALDCPDPAVLADFYSQVTGWPVVFADFTGLVLSGRARRR